MEHKFDLHIHAYEHLIEFTLNHTILFKLNVGGCEYFFYMLSYLHRWSWVFHFYWYCHWFFVIVYSISRNQLHRAIMCTIYAMVIVSMFFGIFRLNTSKFRFQSFFEELTTDNGNLKTSLFAEDTDLAIVYIDEILHQIISCFRKW